jgi:hypothetical protein
MDYIAQKQEQTYSFVWSDVMKNSEPINIIIMRAKGSETDTLQLKYLPRQSLPDMIMMRTIGMTTNIVATSLMDLYRQGTPVIQDTFEAIQQLINLNQNRTEIPSKMKVALEEAVRKASY